MRYTQQFINILINMTFKRVNLDSLRGLFYLDKERENFVNMGIRADE